MDNYRNLYARNRDEANMAQDHNVPAPNGNNNMGRTSSPQSPTTGMERSATPSVQEAKNERDQEQPDVGMMPARPPVQQPDTGMIPGRPPVQQPDTGMIPGRPPVQQPDTGMIPVLPPNMRPPMDTTDRISFLMQRCMNNMMYVRTRDGESFWFYPFQLYQGTVNGYRWNQQAGWFPYSIAVTSIQDAYCYSY